MSFLKVYMIFRGYSTLKEIEILWTIVDDLIFYRLKILMYYFWETLHETLSTKLNFSNAFHHQTNGLSERTIQTLEDMLRACVLEFKGA